MVRFFLHTGLRYGLIGVWLHRKVLSWRLWMLFRMRWVRTSIRQKLLGIITILEHSGPEVGFGATTPSGEFQSEVVVYGLAEFLLAAKIAFSCLNGCMPQQKLNLLKFSAR
jgi:hypothetical protein